MIDMRETFELLLYPFYDRIAGSFDLDRFMASEAVLNFPYYHISDANLPCFVMANKRETVAILVIVNEADANDKYYPCSNYYFIAATAEDEDAAYLLDMAEEHGIPIDNTTWGTMFARMVCAIDGGGDYIDATLIHGMDNWYTTDRFDTDYYG